MDDRAKTARRYSDQATAATESTMKDAHNAKVVEMVRANAEAALEASTQIASAKNPIDLAQAWSSYAAKQFAMLTE